MANPLMSIFGSMTGGAGGGSFLKIIGKIAGAIIRGESPVEFAQRLAQTEPALQGLDLSDLQGAAHKLCQERGIDEAKLTAEIKQSMSSALK